MSRQADPSLTWDHNSPINIFDSLVAPASPGLVLFPVGSVLAAEMGLDRSTVDYYDKPCP
jgi:hypothetical protein